MAPVTVILTVYKRNHLKEQLTTLLNQTIRPERIWVLHYEEHIPDSLLPCHREQGVEFFRFTTNLKYFGRFSLAIHVSTTYTWVLDDDIIPGPAWLESCLRVNESNPAIVCSNGRIIPPNNYRPELPKSADYLTNYFIGDSHSLADSINTCPADTLVDYGCSSYFLRTEWINHFWAIWPGTLQTGEDMHLSATCKLLGGVNTIVAKQTSPFDSGNIRPTYSIDDHASWRQNRFIDERQEVLHYLINNKKWKPTLW